MDLSLFFLLIIDKWFIGIGFIENVWLSFKFEFLKFIKICGIVGLFDVRLIWKYFVEKKIMENYFIVM